MRKTFLKNIRRENINHLSNRQKKNKCTATSITKIRELKGFFLWFTNRIFLLSIWKHIRTIMCTSRPKVFSYKLKHIYQNYFLNSFSFIFKYVLNFPYPIYFSMLETILEVESHFSSLSERFVYIDQSQALFTWHKQKVATLLLRCVSEGIKSIKV